MSKYEEADLILKLYELRREATMRQARDWYVRDFNPESAADVQAAMFGEQGGYLRMVLSYWEMAAALVNRGAIDVDLFDEANSEHILAFAKIEPLLGELRASLTPRFAVSLEKMIDAIPDGRQRAADMRERVKAVRSQRAARQSQTASA